MPDKGETDELEERPVTNMGTWNKQRGTEHDHVAQMSTLDPSGACHQNTPDQL